MSEQVLSVDPITLDLKFQRLEFETGFDVRALIEERDRLKAALVECAELSGADISDGVPTWPPVHEWAPNEVQELRDRYDEALGESCVCVDRSEQP